MSFFKNSKNEKIKDKATGQSVKQFFIAVFSVLLLALVINIAITNNAYSCFNPLFVLPLTVFIALVLIYIYRRIDKYSDIIQKHFTKLLGALLVIILAAQIVVGLHLRFTPIYDMGSIYFGGLTLAETGELGKYTEYFGMFSNNLGGLGVFTALAWFCKLFAIEDLYAVAVVFNSLSLCAGLGCAALSARKLLGTPAAIFSLVAVMLLPSFYTFGATIYTDVLSLPFAACSLWAYLCAKQEGGLCKRTVCAIACGVLLAIGASIKGTVAILVLAYAIDLLLSGIKKHFIAISLVPVSITYILLISMLLSGVVPKDVAYQKGIPWTHWVAMSAHGIGTYNGQDYADAKARPNKDARIEADKEIISRRYQELGIMGSLRLWKDKTVRNFGNGTFSTSDFLDDNPAQYGLLQKTVLPNGEYYSLYANLSQAVFLAILLLAAIGVFFSMKDTVSFLPLLAVAGLMLFLFFWEASARYVTNFFPFMLLAGVASVKKIALYLDNRSNGSKKHISRKERNVIG